MRWTWKRHDSADLAAVKERVDALAREAEHLRGAPAVSYTPNVPGAITDLSAPAAAMLKQLPGVATVEVLVTCEAPTHRIIHVRDWHLVTREELLPPVQTALGRTISDKEGDLRVVELELQVEIVQAEQLAALRSLVQHHGLKRVLSENVTAQGLADFNHHLDDLRDLNRLLGNLAKARDGLKTKDNELDRQAADLMAGHRLRLLEVGAAARLAVEGLAEVLPLEDERHAGAGHPFAPDGTVRQDTAGVERRHDHQVQTAIASGPVTVLVLGAAHDLSASVRRQGADIEYQQANARLAGLDQRLFADVDRQILPSNLFGMDLNAAAG